MYWSYPYHAGNAYVSQQQRDDRNFSEDLMQANIGRRVSAYMTYDASEQWRNRVFTGVLRQVGRDYFVLRDQSSGKDVMLLNINLNFMVFEDRAQLAKD
ncbi:spore coat protein GerQ [Staphylospora marina]|uniref:spore coat protein GerQ n=1 Tax=Staphylospora marina TaxID=2490858 RepID=UPI000F5B9892|nr:spore coat protein GerQ [Staphylospora marina]